MKNLKKVLALVLAFAMVMTMFASAATYADVSSDSEYYNAVTLLSDLGIVTGYTDGTYGPEQTITRAEACALVARMLTGKTDVAEYKGASSFTDVASDYWGESAIGYCVVNNIVVGDGDGKFRPDDAVTQAEFVTMVTRGLGYETTSSPLTYPYGYISAAQDNGVLDDVTIVPTEPALRGMDAVIIYNAIFADYPKMATYKYVNGVYTQDIPTVAEYVYNIYELGKVLAGTSTTANQFTTQTGNTFSYDEDTTFVVTGKSTEVEDVVYVRPIGKSGNTYYGFAVSQTIGTGTNATTTAINTMAYDCDMTKAQIDAIKGYEVKIYVDKDDDNIVAFEVLDSQSLYEIDSTNYTETSTDDENDGKVMIDGKKIQINSAWNNADLTEIFGDDYDNLEAFVDGMKDSYQFELIDWNNDRDIDYVKESSRIYAYVSSYTGNKIAFITDARNGLTRLPDEDGTGTLNASIDITDDSYDYEWVIEDGVQEGSVVEIDIEREYSTEAKGCFATYTVSLATEVAEVTFESVKSGTEDKKGGDWYFDGTKYKIAKKNLIGKTSDENEEDFTDDYEDFLGDTFNLYLDRNGYVVFATSVDSTFDDYMLILDTSGDVSSTLDTAKVYALIDTDTYKTISVSDDIDSSVGLYDADRNGFGATSGSPVNPVGSLVAYKLDENGKLDDWENAGNAITPALDSTNTPNGDADKRVGGGIEAYDDDTYKVTINNKKYLLEDDTKIFLFTSDAIKTADDGNNDETTENMKEYSKVVTASELAEVTSSQVAAGGEYYGLQAVAVTRSGSKSSILEAIAIYDPSGKYFDAATGDKYPAIISSITQSIVSGSSSKYSYEVSLYINGEKKSLKTENMTSSKFASDVLDVTERKKNGLPYFASAKEAKNKLAWVSINGDDEITEIIPLTDNYGYAGSSAADTANEVTVTRAIVAAKNGKGVTFIPLEGDYDVDGDGNIASTEKFSGWTYSTTSTTDKNVVAEILSDGKGGSTKTQLSNYAAFASDAAFYTLNVRPASYKLTNALDDSLDGDYTVEIGSSSDVLVSTINGQETDVYYVADIFFNDDADISAMVIYTKDINTTADLTDGDSDEETNDASLRTQVMAASSKKVANIAVDDIPTGATVTVDGTDYTDNVKNGTLIIDPSFYAQAGNVKIVVKKDGLATKTLTLVVTSSAVVASDLYDLDNIQVYSWVGGKNIQLLFFYSKEGGNDYWFTEDDIETLFEVNGLDFLSSIEVIYTPTDGTKTTLTLDDYTIESCNDQAGTEQVIGKDYASKDFLKLYPTDQTAKVGTISVKLNGETVVPTFDVDPDDNAKGSSENVVSKNP
jgi:hypothetical protein